MSEARAYLTLKRAARASGVQGMRAVNLVRSGATAARGA